MLFALGRAGLELNLPETKPLLNLTDVRNKRY